MKNWALIWKRGHFSNSFPKSCVCTIPIVSCTKCACMQKLKTFVWWFFDDGMLHFTPVSLLCHSHNLKKSPWNATNPFSFASFLCWAMKHLLYMRCAKKENRMLGTYHVMWQSSQTENAIRKNFILLATYSPFSRSWVHYGNGIGKFILKCNHIPFLNVEVLPKFWGIWSKFDRGRQKMMSLLTYYRGETPSF